MFHFQEKGENFVQERKFVNDIRDDRQCEKDELIPSMGRSLWRVLSMS